MSRTPPALPPPWPPNWVRTTAFFFGLGLAAAEFAWDRSEHFFVYGIAFVFSGLPLARGADRIIDLLSSRPGPK